MFRDYSIFVETLRDNLNYLYALTSFLMQRYQVYTNKNHPELRDFNYGSGADI
jgi:hypothetical protein